MLYSTEKGHCIEQAVSGAHVVTMGINPSKRQLHEGHYLTMYQALKALKKNKHATGLFFVDDREHHHKARSMADEKHLRLPCFAAASDIAKIMMQFAFRVENFLKLSNLVSRIKIQPMSEYMSEGKSSGESNGARIYSLLWDLREEIESTFEFDQEQGTSSITPLCPDCHYGPLSNENVDLREDGITAKCMLTSCETRSYLVKTLEGDSNWSMHYTVDPLRDIDTARKVQGRVLHVFGGDYGLPWGNYGRSKVERLHELVSEVEPNAVDYFVGPLLQRGGRKLAKSDNDSSRPPRIETLDAILRQHSAVIEV